MSAPDLKLIKLASRLRWLKHYCNSEPSLSCLWKKLFKLNLSELGVDFDVLLHCNFAEENVAITKLQPFYQDLVKAWISVNGVDKKPLSEQCIWYNKNITISTISVMSPGLFKSGLRFCSDLFMENGDLIPFKIWQERGTKPREYIIWNALVNKISVLKKKMEWNRKSTLNDNVFTFIDLCINDGTSTIMFSNSTTQMLYQCLVSCMYNLGEVTPRILNSLSIKSISPKEVFLRHFTILRDTKLQEFQFKLLYDILITNYWLKRFELSETDACTFCGIECESLLHLFWSCRYAADFWSEVEKWWLRKRGKL